MPLIKITTASLLSSRVAIFSLSSMSLSMKFVLTPPFLGMPVQAKQCSYEMPSCSLVKHFTSIMSLGLEIKTIILVVPLPPLSTTFGSILEPKTRPYSPHFFPDNNQTTPWPSRLLNRFRPKILVPSGLPLMSVLTHFIPFFTGPAVTTMSNSGSYLVAPVASQYSSPTPVAHSYSSHGCADILLLSMTLGLIPTQSLLHLTIYPALMWVLRVPVISFALYHFHWTWPSPYSGRSLSAFSLFTCHHIYSSLVLT